MFAFEEVITFFVVATGIPRSLCMAIGRSRSARCGAFFVTSTSDRQISPGSSAIVSQRGNETDVACTNAGSTILVSASECEFNSILGSCPLDFGIDYHAAMFTKCRLAEANRTHIHPT